MSPEQISLRYNLASVEARAVEGSNELPPITGMAAVYFDPANPDGTQYYLRSAAANQPEVVERIKPGIFDGMIGDMHDIEARQDHDPALFLGRTSSKTLTVTLNERGLAYEIKTPNTQVGRDTLHLIERRDISGSSFQMFRPTATWSYELAGTEKRYVRNVNSLQQIVDLGPVLHPAYRGTSAQLGKRSCGMTCLARSSGPPAELVAIESELSAFINQNWHASEAALRLQQIAFASA